MSKRLGLVFWMAFLIALPFQLRVIIGEWHGEWGSYAFYGSDILLVILFVVTPRWWKELRFFPGRWMLMFFVALSALSLVVASDVGLGFFRLLFLLKGVALAGVAAFWFQSRPHYSAFGLVLAGLIQAAVGLGQFIKQSHLGLQFLGESVLNVTIPGVAEVMSRGVLYLRPYGLTPHPNVLAVILVVGIFVGWALLPRVWKPHNARNLFLISAGSLLLVAFLLTFSRLVVGAAFVGGLLLMGWLLVGWHRKRRFPIQSLFVVGLLFVVFFWMLWPWWSDRLIAFGSDQSMSLRSFYTEQSIETIKEHPLFGVGIGNSTLLLREELRPSESWVIQPVHSMYFLIASETGVVTLGVLLLFLSALFRRWRLSLSVLSVVRHHYAVTLGVLLLMFLGIAMFEHLFSTLQQGLLLFWLVVGGVVGLTNVRGRVDVRA